MLTAEATDNTFEITHSDGSKYQFPIREIDPKTQHLIPSKEKHKDYILENPYINQILYLAKQGSNILLQGEPSCGKSELVCWLAANTNTPLVQVQGDGDLGVIDIIGGPTFRQDEGGTNFVDGVITFGLKNNCWILFDEMNMALPEILSRLHSVLDSRRHLDLKEDNRIIPRSDETVFFGTMNPSDDGRHVGTKPLSPALKSRLDLVVNFTFLSQKAEKELLMRRTGISESDAELIIKVAQEARDGFKKQEVSEVIDTRMTLQWARMAVEFGLGPAVQCTILSRVTEDTFDVLRGVLVSHGVVKLGDN